MLDGGWTAQMCEASYLIPARDIVQGTRAVVAEVNLGAIVTSLMSAPDATAALVFGSGF